MFCMKHNCDCRRVVLNVTDNKFKSVAMIGYGWGDKKFYKKWYKSELISDKKITDFIGTSHFNGIKISPYSDYFLSFFKKVLLNNKNYIELIKNHYNLVKELQKKTLSLLKTN
jgi:hypothetical protein